MKVSTWLVQAPSTATSAARARLGADRFTGASSGAGSFLDRAAGPDEYRPKRGPARRAGPAPSASTVGGRADSPRPVRLDGRPGSVDANAVPDAALVAVGVVDQARIDVQLHGRAPHGFVGGPLRQARVRGRAVRYEVHPGAMYRLRERVRRVVRDVAPARHGFVECVPHERQVQLVRRAEALERTPV